jgi:hypothetical protein
MRQAVGRSDPAIIAVIVGWAVMLLFPTISN